MHNVSDVVAGYLLGAGVVLAWLAFYDPTPRSTALAVPPLAEAVPNQRKKLAVILNPSKIDEVDQFRTLVEALATESGFATVVWWETDRRGHRLRDGARGGRQRRRPGDRHRW